MLFSRPMFTYLHLRLLISLNVKHFCSILIMFKYTAAFLHTAVFLYLTHGLCNVTAKWFYYRIAMAGAC